MTRKPIIGITGNEKMVQDASQDNSIIVRTFASKAFSDAVVAAGGIPIIIPIGDVTMAAEYVSMIDKLIITGGQNVWPEYYGEELVIESNDYHLERDAFEFELIKEALRQDKPIFSVCRGTQLFNVALGGTLNQEWDNHWQKEASTKTTQSLKVKEGTALAEIYGQSSSINSFHRQSIKEVAPQLEVIAVDPKDDTIEAVQSKADFRYLGVQWHPELLLKQHQENLNLFKYVVNVL